MPSTRDTALVLDTYNQMRPKLVQWLIFDNSERTITVGTDEFKYRPINQYLKDYKGNDAKIVCEQTSSAKTTRRIPSFGSVHRCASDLSDIRSYENTVCFRHTPGLAYNRIVANQSTNPVATAFVQKFLDPDVTVLPGSLDSVGKLMYSAETSNNEYIGTNVTLLPPSYPKGTAGATSYDTVTQMKHEFPGTALQKIVNGGTEKIHAAFAPYPGYDTSFSTAFSNEYESYLSDGIINFNFLEYSMLYKNEYDTQRVGFNELLDAILKSDYSDVYLQPDLHNIFQLHTHDEFASGEEGLEYVKIGPEFVNQTASNAFKFKLTDDDAVKSEVNKLFTTDLGNVKQESSNPPNEFPPLQRVQAVGGGFATISAGDDLPVFCMNAPKDFAVLFWEIPIASFRSNEERTIVTEDDSGGQLTGSGIASASNCNKFDLYNGAMLDPTVASEFTTLDVATPVKLNFLHVPC